MTLVASRELRNQTRSLLDRVEAGERLTITVDGRPIADLVPTAARRRWMPREEFVARIGGHQADSALAEVLDEMVEGTTDDISW